MVDRSVTVALRAQVDGFRRAMKDAEKATRDVGDQAEKASKRATTASERMVTSARDNRQAWDTAGAALAGFGAITVGALGASTKAAIDWESAFAGVKKTVDDSEAGYAALSDELRNMAKELPATHQEIAAVAEAAGQLGVERDAIASFTRTMIDLGETTNLSADQAATAIAQMTNVMQTAPEDVSRLGAALVELGNNGASTEAEIIDMAQRISGAAATVGLAESDVLALANTVTSMGINAEAGGTAVTRVLTDMGKAAAMGGEDLAAFARVAGVSAEDFARSFREDPAEAFATFIDGLNGIQAAGGNVFGTLDQLGLSDVRVSQALLGMASAGDLLRESLETGSQAWEENTALAEEAAKRYETTAAQIDITKNNITDAAIGFGEVLLPAVRDASEAVRGFSEWLGGLSEGQQTAVASLSAIAGGATLLGGAFLLAFPRVMDTIGAFRDLQRVSPRAASALGTVGKAAGITAAALTGLNVAYNLLSSSNEAVQSASELTAALADAGLTIAEVDAQVVNLQRDLLLGTVGFDSLEQGLRSITDPGITDRLADLGYEIISLGSADGRAEREDLIRQLEATGQALATLTSSGNAELAGEQFDVYAEAAAAAGLSTEELLDLMPAYRDALADAEAEQSLAAQGSQEFAHGLGGVAMEASDAEASLDALSDALDGLLGRFFSVDEATDRFYEALNALGDAAETNGTSLSGFSDEAIANRDALRGQVEAAVAVIQAMAEQGASSDVLAAKAAELKGAIEEAAGAAGYERGEVQKLTGALDEVPALVETTIEANTAGALSQINGLSARLAALDGTTATVAVRYRQTGGGTLVRDVDIARADGGLVPLGLGGPKQDNVLARLSSGEYVVNAAATRKYLPLLEGINAQRFADGGLVGYADGGWVEQARGIVASGGTADDVRAMVREWDELVRVQEHALRLREAEAELEEAIAERQEITRGDEAKARADERIADARKRIADLKADEQLRQEKALVDALVESLEAEADAREEAARAAEDLARKRASTMQDALSELNSLLDAQDGLYRRQVESEQRLSQGLADALGDYRRAQDEARRARADALAGSMRLSDPYQEQWGASVGWLTENALGQAALFDEWSDELQAAKRMGLSDEVIAALGLDAGPEALGQLRQITSATVDEVEALNSAVAQRSREINEQVSWESRTGFGQLGQDLSALHEDYVSRVRELQATFREEQAQIAAELAELGREQGRSYGEALAEGLDSQVAAVRAAAARLQAAMGYAGGVSRAAEIESIFDRYGVDPSLHGDASREDPAARIARLAASDRSLADIERSVRNIGLRFDTFDSGGLLMPGLTLAYNGTGMPERVSTASQMVPEVSVYVQSPVDGEWVRSQARVVVDQAGASLRQGVRSRGRRSA